jgi:hypothetical protein
MARIPQQIVVDTPAPGAVGAGLAQQQASVSPEMFGAATARGIGQLGSALGDLGAVANREVLAEQRILNETAATTAANAFHVESGRLWGDYASLQGTEATAAYPEFQENMAALRQRFLENSPNQAVRRQLDRSIGGAAASLEAQAAQRNSVNVRNAGVQAQEGAQVVAINEGVRLRDDPAGREIAYAQGLRAVQVQGAIQGWDAATLQSNMAAFRGRFWSGVIASTADTDPLRAQAIFDEQRNQMDAQAQIRVENFLRAPVQARRADDIVAWATGPQAGANPPAPGTPGNRQGGVPNPPDAVRDQAARAESGGRNIANAAGSSATGPLQITRGTWNTYAERLGLERDEEGRPAPANRGDRATQDKIWDLYQADARQSIGRDLTPNEQYAAWFLGIAGAKAFIMADPNADAYQTYAAVATNGVADQAFRMNGNLLRPGMTVGQANAAIGAYFNRYGGGGPTEGGGRQGRDTQLQAALSRAGNDPELRAAVMSRIRAQWGVEDSMQHAERAQMDARLTALSDALALGTTASIPTADIRRLYQPEQANSILQNLTLKQIEGDVFRSVQLATPADIMSMQQDLANGAGPITQQLRERRGTVLGADGQVVEDQRAQDLLARQQLGNALNRAVTGRARQLASDPAQYAMADPAVRAAAQAQQANNTPQTTQAYVTATLAAQERLGVPAADRRVLSVAVAQNIAARISSADPGGGTTREPSSAAGQLQALASQYGAAWPQAFGDLVRDGKLAPEYQVLANIPTPAGQGDFQRALMSLRNAGSADKYGNLVPDVERKVINDGIDTALSAFRTTATAGQQSGGDALYGHVHSSVRTLAYHYAIGGMSGSEALRAAVDRVLNDKYEFSGTVRVPKQDNKGAPLGLVAVRPAIQQVQRNLKPEDLMVPESSNALLDESTRRQNYFRMAQAAVWVPNRDDTGLILAGTWEMGVRVPVRRADGSMIEVKFDNLPPIEQRVSNSRDNPARGVQRIEGFDAPEDEAPTTSPLAFPPRVN